MAKWATKSCKCTIEYSSFFISTKCLTFSIFSENCIDFLINAHCVSSQFQMLQILCLFVENSPEPLEQLWPLFAGKLKPYIMNALKSVKWCSGTGIPLECHIFILDHINQMHTVMHNERWIYSELIESVKFDDRLTITCQVSVLNFH